MLYKNMIQPQIHEFLDDATEIEYLNMEKDREKLQDYLSGDVVEYTITGKEELEMNAFGYEFIGKIIMLQNDDNVTAVITSEELYSKSEKGDKLQLYRNYKYERLLELNSGELLNEVNYEQLE